jgi:hypothetical protein
LRTLNPKVALEWDTERNGTKTPDTVTANNNKKAWWECSLGHSWHAVIASRNIGNGCPYCANKKVLPGFNDLLTVMPKLALEWDDTKNGDLRPENVVAGSNKSIWWKCQKCNHSWKAIVDSRKRSGCPCCAGKIVVIGENDLKSRRHDLCKEWDTLKNGRLTPEMITYSANKTAWWTCPKGHSYKARIYSRANGSGCPYCTGKLPIVGETDFGTMHPELLSEWDFKKNELIRPEQITASSTKKIWWRCKEGHSWRTSACHRHKGRGCPYCANLRDRRNVVVGTNDLATIYPTIAAEWDANRNGELTPQSIRPGSECDVWWVCERGHHWKAIVASRTRGAGCPYCKGKRPMKTRLV